MVNRVRRRDFLKAGAAGVFGGSLLWAPASYATQKRPAFQLTAANGRLEGVIRGRISTVGMAQVFKHEELPHPFKS